MNKKEIFIPLIALAILVPIAIIKCTNKHSAVKEDKAIQAIEKIRYEDTTSYWHDQYDNEHALRQQADGNLQQLKAVYNDVITAKAKELGIKQSDIKAVTGFNVVHEPIRGADTTWRIDSSDGNMFPCFTCPVGILRLGDTGRFNNLKMLPDGAYQMQVKDSLSIIEYSKKIGWFKRAPFIDIVSYTPGTRVTDIQGFRVASGTTSWLTVGPSGALIYSNKQIVPAAGVGVVIRVLKVPISLSLLKMFN